MTAPTASDKYAERAARRLRALLDETAAAPSDLLGRSNFLAQKLGVAIEQATQMLGGRVRWEWDLLDTACAAFGKQPGYFLDKRPENIPSDTKLITSVNAGDSMVLRPPEGIVPPDLPEGRWRYGSEGGTPILFPMRSLLVFAEAAAQFDVKTGVTYAIEGDNGVEFMRCANVTNSVATFEPNLRGGPKVMLPLPGKRNGAKQDRSIAGPVFVTVQPATAP